MTTLTVTRNARIPDPAILMRQRNMLWNKIILKDKKRVSNNNYPRPSRKGRHYRERFVMPLKYREHGYLRNPAKGRL